MRDVVDSVGSILRSSCVGRTMFGGKCTLCLFFAACNAPAQGRHPLVVRSSGSSSSRKQDHLDHTGGHHEHTTTNVAIIMSWAFMITALLSSSRLMATMSGDEDSTDTAVVARIGPYRIILPS